MKNQPMEPASAADPLQQAMSTTPQFTKVAYIYDDLMAGVAYSLWLNYVRELWRSRGVWPGSVLDVACGTGNVSFQLAAEGFVVAGVDASAGMIEVANSKFPKKRTLRPANPVFYCQDAAEMDVPGRFDAALSLFDSLNYILEPARLVRAFARVYHQLIPGGVFIFDVNTEYALSHGFFNQDNLDSGSYPRYVWKSSWDPATRLCTVEMDFEALGESCVERFHETHYQRGYSIDELRTGLEDAGFVNIDFFHAFSFRKPGKKTDRLYVVAEKRVEAV